MPDATLAYGEHPEQVADVWWPDGPPAEPPAGPPALVVVVHGGFWRQGWDRAHVRPFCAALAGRGWTVGAPEYRRTGGSGGWPGTLDDMAAAADRLTGLVTAAAAAAAGGPRRHAPARYVLVGHSAGGHLAHWAAGRHRLPASSRWRRDGRDPALAGVLGLAPVASLVSAARERLGDGAAELLVGAPVDAAPQRWAQADPVRLVPTGVRTVLLHGDEDESVPVSQSRELVAAARAAGDDPDLRLLPRTDHMSLVDPTSEAWPHVTAALSDLLRGAT